MTKTVKEVSEAIDKKIAEEAKKMTLGRKIIEIKKDIRFFTKDKKGYNYSYVTGSQILARIKENMETYGVLLMPSISGKDPYQLFEYDTKNAKGQIKHNRDYVISGDMLYSWVNADDMLDRIDLPWSFFGSQDDISKSFGSALTYAERYFLLKFFNIPTDDIDPDAFQDDKSYVAPKKEPIDDFIDGPKKPEVKKTENKEEKENNELADNVNYDRWETVFKKKLIELVKEKGEGKVTVEDVKQLGVNMQKEMKTDKKDPLYIKLRDNILIPYINKL